MYMYIYKQRLVPKHSQGFRRPERPEEKSPQQNHICLVLTGRGLCALLPYGRREREREGQCEHNTQSPWNDAFNTGRTVPRARF